MTGRRGSTGPAAGDGTPASPPSMAPPAPPSALPIPVARGLLGAVVAPHHLATRAGLDVLVAGGTAVDAAIATNAVLGVVMPNACGIGGDAFWLIWDQAAGRLSGLNGSGRAPAGADPDRLVAGGLDRLPRRGPLAVTVPGAVRSWGDAHGRFGRLPVERLLAPAIELAEGGFAAWPGFAAAVESLAAEIEGEPWAGGFGGVFRPAGRPWRLGEAVRLPALAATLRRLAGDGIDDFYDGDLGARQAAFLASMGAPFTAADVVGHRSTWTEPIEASYRGVRVTTHPPNSSGVVALEILNVLERFGPPGGEAFRAGGGPDAGWIHLAIEAAKLAMADRDAHLTDPAFLAPPLERLLDKGYAATLAARIDPRRASRPPAAANPPGGGTIFLATVDPAGNAVALIESNYHGFGSGVVDPATGIGYQNRGAHFSLRAGHPNRLAPGKRTLHTLLPLMLFREPAGSGSAPWVVGGSMGGEAQPQIAAQLVAGLVDGGLDVGRAVGAPRFFVEPADLYAPPVLVRAEPRFAPGVLEAVEALGHPVVRTAAFDSLVGHAHAIELIDGGPAAGGSVAAATDPRSAGLPAAW